jgi:SAM-dependent methyltransferase
MDDGSVAARHRQRTFAWYGFGMEALRRVARLLDGAVGRSRLQEKLLVTLLGQYYKSRSRYQWKWAAADQVPHFFDQRLGFFDFGFGEGTFGPYPYYRGFLNSEVIRPGDILLDIGCGDGFFTRRFLAPRCSSIDAVDIEPSAIETAQALNGGPNIIYHLLDAAVQPFPRDRYDVVVWDGALGHFRPETTAGMLGKISAAIGDGGIFVGSESLGREGTDHLQVFDSLESLRTIFTSHFKLVALREEEYAIPGGFLRKEAYWRCAQDPVRLRRGQWHP